jgi:hypothetical protein
MNMTLDHSVVVYEALPRMDGQGDRQRADNEPRGFAPRIGGGPPPWRRVRGWLFGDRADIDQEGLLAERTLKIGPRRARRDEPGGDAGTRTDSGDEPA